MIGLNSTSVPAAGQALEQAGQSGQTGSAAQHSSGAGQFSSLLQRQLTLARLAQVNAFGGLGGFGNLAPGGLFRQGLAPAGQFLPAALPPLQGAAIPSVTITTTTSINVPLNALTGLEATEAGGEFGAYLQNLDLSALAAAQGNGTEPAAPLNAEAEALPALLPAEQQAVLAIPETPDDLGSKLGERLVSLGQDGDTGLQAVFDHPRYGAIGVDLKIRDNEVTLAIETQDAELKSALEAAGATLGKSLSEAGMTLGDFSVNGSTELAELTGAGAIGQTSLKSLLDLYAALQNKGDTPIDLVNGLA